MEFSESFGRTQSFTMIVVASGLLYAASRTAVFALSRSDGSDPGRRAIAQWLPIASTVIAAVLLRRADIAVAVAIGTSVACLTLAMGLATYVMPMKTLPDSRRAWPFVLPAALLALMAGFSTCLTWWHALMMLALGGAILRVWRVSSREDHDSAPPLPSGQTGLTLILALVLMGLGGYLAVTGDLACSANTRVISPGTIAATILSPLLVLPMLSGASSVAQAGRTGQAVTALIATALLNLCALLPIAILLWYPATSGWSLHSYRDFRAPWESVHALPYAIATWRIDTVILVVMGFSLVPVSIGRLTVGRTESVLLMVGYAIYILLLTVFGAQLV